MAIFYAAVDGDPLTSGKGGYVHATFCPSTIDDESGKPRRIAFIGDSAWCSACKCEGAITYGVSVRKGGRMFMGGREQAVGGDLVLCKCSTPPQIIATYAKSRWQIVDTDSAGPAAHSGKHAFATATSVRNASDAREHADRYALIDSATDMPIANAVYAIKRASGAIEHGTTDSAGHTHLLSAIADAEAIEIYLEG